MISFVIYSIILSYFKVKRGIELENSEIWLVLPKEDLDSNSQIW